MCLAWLCFSGQLVAIVLNLLEDGMAWMVGRVAAGLCAHVVLNFRRLVMAAWRTFHPYDSGFCQPFVRRGLVARQWRGSAACRLEQQFTLSPPFAPRTEQQRPVAQSPLFSPRSEASDSNLNDTSVMEQLCSGHTR